MLQESNGRSIIKVISWCFWASLTTAALVFAFTGEIEIALVIAGLEIVLKLLLYFFHERAWNKILYGRKEVQPGVIWLTGFSGSGKSTIGEAVYKKIKAKGIKAEHLDGDKVRDIFPNTGFSKEERNRHIKRVGFLASMLEKNSVFVVASFISPYKESREFVRELCRNYTEVHIATPLKICEQRDVKGLYAKARAGDITQFTGIDDPYEEPENAEIIVDTSNQSIEESVGVVMKGLGF